jgi:dihydroxyacetone synthase
MHIAQDEPVTNGATEYGKNVVTGLQKEARLEQSAVQNLTKEQDHVLKTFRMLIADLCQQFNGGHPGQVFPMKLAEARLTSTLVAQLAWRPLESHSGSM